MTGFEQVAWFPLCAGLTAIGLVLSWLAWRRRGAAAGLRWVGWSLLPLAAYLLGIISALWEMGTAVAGWALSLVISPVVWAGIALVGVSVVAFVVSGMLRRRGSGGAATGRAATGGAATRASDTATRKAVGGSQRERAPEASRGAASDEDDDFSDVEEILRRRGIS